MSFSGNLEHLSIVDVMQLLETTKKSGTLFVKNNGIEYRFSFANGFIVSITHPDNLSSLAQLLSFRKVMGLEDAKKIVGICINSKKTLTSFLLENGILDTKSIKDILTNFVEITVINILTWEKGSFHLSVDEIEISDEFKSFSAITKNDLYISTQNTLMEALRIFDELRRDNLLSQVIFQHEEEKHENKPEDITITEDILGLDIIDKLERKIPDVFTGIKEIDHTNVHRKKVKEFLPDIQKNQEDELVNFLARLDVKKTENTSSYTIIYYGNDEFLCHVINTICKNLGIFVFSTDAQENFEIIIKQSKLKGLKTILIIDSEHPIEMETDFEDISFIYFQKNCETKHILKYLEDKAMVVFPKPEKGDIQNLLLFYNSILNYLKRYQTKEYRVDKLKEVIKKIIESEKTSHIRNIIADFLNQYFERVIVFIIHQGFLLSERCLLPDLQTSSFKISVNEFSKFVELKNGKEPDIFRLDVIPENPIYKYIPIAKGKKCFLMYLSAMGKNISLFYCDNEKKNFDTSLIESIKKIAQIQIENILYRKMFEKTKKTE
mgnify:CR=1 FL=1